MLGLQTDKPVLDSGSESASRHRTMQLGLGEPLASAIRVMCIEKMKKLSGRKRQKSSGEAGRLLVPPTQFFAGAGTHSSGRFCSMAPVLFNFVRMSDAQLPLMSGSFDLISASQRF